MTSFLQKRWTPLIIWTLIIFLASLNPNPLFGLSKMLESAALLGIYLDKVLWALAHLVTYGVLTFLLVRALSWEKELSSLALLTAFVAALLFALTNELLQIPVPDRAFEPGDLLLAGWGALLGLLGYILWHQQRSQRDEEPDLLI